MLKKIEKGKYYATEGREQICYIKCLDPGLMVMDIANLESGYFIDNFMAGKERVTMLLEATNEEVRKYERIKTRGD